MAQSCGRVTACQGTVVEVALEEGDVAPGRRLRGSRVAPGRIGDEGVGRRQDPGLSTGRDASSFSAASGRASATLPSALCAISGRTS